MCWYSYDLYICGCKGKLYTSRSSDWICNIARDRPRLPNGDFDVCGIPHTNQPRSARSHEVARELDYCCCRHCCTVDILEYLRDRGWPDADYLDARKLERTPLQGPQALYPGTLVWDARNRHHHCRFLMERDVNAAEMRALWATEENQRFGGRGGLGGRPSGRPGGIGPLRNDGTQPSLIDSR